MDSVSATLPQSLRRIFVATLLKDLLSEYISHQGRGGGPELESALDTIGNRTNDLRRQLRRAVVDHVSDAFLDTETPLNQLVQVS